MLPWIKRLKIKLADGLSDGGAYLYKCVASPSKPKRRLEGSKDSEAESQGPSKRQLVRREEDEKEQRQPLSNARDVTMAPKQNPLKASPIASLELYKWKDPPVPPSEKRNRSTTGHKTNLRPLQPPQAGETPSPIGQPSKALDDKSRHALETNYQLFLKRERDQIEVRSVEPLIQVADEQPAYIVVEDAGGTLGAAARPSAVRKAPCGDLTIDYYNGFRPSLSFDYEAKLPAPIDMVKQAAEFAKKKSATQSERLRESLRKAKAVVDNKEIETRIRSLDELLQEIDIGRKKCEDIRLGRQSRFPRRLPVLTNEDREQYENLIRTAEMTMLVAHPRSNIEIKGHDMQKLGPGQWLNDEAINLSMSLLQERDLQRRESDPQGPKCHFFNSFFTSKLYKDDRKYNYNSVRRWTLPPRLKRAGQLSPSVLDCDRIIIPINQGQMHWVCAVIDLKNEKFIFYDSLHGKDPTCLQYLAQYLKDEFQNKKNEDRPDIMDWPREFPEDIPRQRNGYDCGVFTILFADYAGLAAKLDFSQDHIQDFRVRIVRDIMRLKID